ncbi:hypothetical protein [Kaistia defluvii]|uniref:Uncharacterized protein n=1 Tax=Kaistia defluvii TaxID=410841 RepID=A0ABV2R149_9HYPH
MNASQQPPQETPSPLASIDVQQLLDFVEHMPERFTPVVQTDPDGPFAYYIVNYLVNDDLRSQVLVIDPDFAVTLRKLATAFIPLPETGERA